MWLAPIWAASSCGSPQGHDLLEELFLPGWHAEAQQPHRLLGSVGEGVRRVGRDVDGLTGVTATAHA
jgi:hypothetical protein